MKQVKTHFIYLLLFVVVSFVGCDASEQEDIDPHKKPVFQEQIELISKGLSVPLKNEVEDVVWRSSDWRSVSYQRELIQKERNDFSSLSDEAKNHSYGFENGEFTVSHLSNSTAKGEKESLTFSYTWLENGELEINGINFIVKKENEMLVIYYNYQDKVAVEEIFQINLEEFYEKENAELLNFIGIIHFNQISETNPNPGKEPESAGDYVAGDLANRIVENTKINNALVSTIAVTEDGEVNEFNMTGKFGDEFTLRVTTPVDMSAYKFERGKALFESFFKQTNFIFKGIEMKIQNLSMQRRTLMAIGKVANGNLCSFIYGIYDDIEVWSSQPLFILEEPQKAIDVVNALMNNTEFDGVLVDGITYNTEDNSRFILQSGTNQIRDISLSEPINLETVSDSYVREIFMSFFTRKSFTVESTTFKINSISVQSGEEINVTGLTAEEDAVGVTYNLETGKISL